MRIAIIGAGNVGKALARSASQAGYEVVLSARHPEHAQEAARETGATSVETNAAAVREADVVVFAIPWSAGREVATEIEAETAGKTVIDVTNPLKPDYSGPALEGTSAAEELQRWLPKAKVAKAFNTLFASRQASPTRDVEAFVAADDPDAKREALALAESLGFAPVDVGPLQASRYLEAMAWLNISLNLANSWGWTSAWKLER
jgi:NADPH-dependent F420 reductase